jgi:uncharacterized protein YecA (UPF0149 family)
MADSAGDAARLRLASLLGQWPQAMAPDELQGFCAAVAMAVGAEGPAPEGWQAFALGVDDATPDGELADLLEQFRVETAQALDEGRLAIEARTTRTGRVDHRPWCAAFLEGVEAAGWFGTADGEELDELLFPIEVLADALPERERASYGDAQWRRLAHEATGGLANTVRRLNDYWAIVRAPPVTFRRDAGKVGRNDPCPCGSGRKFKQCHGRT